MTDLPISQLLDLSGKVALVTGANRGIGRAISEVFCRAGAKVAIVARTEKLLQEVAAQLRQTHPAVGDGSDQQHVLALPASVADEAQINRVVETVVATWGRIDILVNNAGLISFGPVSKIDPAKWDQVIATNLTGTYLCSRAVAPVMQRQNSGRIILITSVSAQTGGVSAGVDYAASKGGMAAVTKALARDLAPFGVTVNAIAPGQIDADPELLTPEARQRVVELIPLGRLGEPAEIAYAALFLASPMAAYITGATLDVNGGILKR